MTDQVKAGDKPGKDKPEHPEHPERPDKPDKPDKPGPKPKPDDGRTYG